MVFKNFFNSCYHIVKLSFTSRIYFFKSIIFWRFRAQRWFTLFFPEPGRQKATSWVLSILVDPDSRKRTGINYTVQLMPYNLLIIFPFILFLKIVISDWRFVVLIGEAFAIFSVLEISLATLSFTSTDQIWFQPSYGLFVTPCDLWEVKFDWNRI